MKLSYIFHSGFVLETEQSILVFDYWMDPSGVMDMKTTLRRRFLSGRSRNRISPTFSPKTSTNIGEPAKKMLTCGWPRVAHGLTIRYPYGH